MLQLTKKTKRNMHQTVTVKKYELYSSLCYTNVNPTSSPQFTSLYLTSLHFTLPHFTSQQFLIIFTKHSLHLIYPFSNPFPKIAWITGESPKASADSWFHSGMALIKKNSTA
jgi:hypothetical protein